MERRTRLDKSQLRRIVMESVRSVMNESYRGPLYHFTTLPLLYCILRDNCLTCDYSDEFCDYRKGTCDDYGYPLPSLCFTRDKNYNIREDCGVVCRFVFDAEKLMQIRNAKLYPVNWCKKPKFNKSSEAEERLWGVNVYPLDKYIERIDIIVSDIGDYSNFPHDLDDEFYDKYWDSFSEKYPNASDEEFNRFVGKKMLQGIMRMKKFKGKINLVYK